MRAKFAPRLGSAQRLDPTLAAMKQANFFIAVLLAVVVAACSRPVAPFSPAHVDQSVSQQSRYPLAAEPSLVGTYSGRSKSGGATSMTTSLSTESGSIPSRERRHWLETMTTSPRSRNTSRRWPSRRRTRCRATVVVLRQLESINEPSPGVYRHQSGARITGWLPQWLLGSKREPDSITKFLAAHASTQK